MKKIIVTFVSYKTKKEYTLVSFNEEENTAVVSDSEGNQKTLKYTTLKKTCKRVETEVEVEEPKKEDKTSTGNKHQKIAAKNLKNAYNWNVGSYENSVQDGELEEMPPVEQLFNMVLAEAKGSLYEDGYAGGKAPISMRLAGDKFLRETLKDLFEADGYEVPESLLKTKEKRASNSSNKSQNRLRKDEGDDTVTVYAFTGMLIGTFEVSDKTDSTISIIDRKGRELVFDRKTGKQVNASNSRFANKIDL